MTLEQQQVNVQELQRLHEAIAVTMDAIRRVAPHLLQQGQTYSPYAQAFGREGQPGPWQHLGQQLPWQQPTAQPQMPWQQPIAQWQQPIAQWQQPIAQWQQPYGYQPFGIGQQGLGGYGQPGFGAYGQSFGGYGQQLDPVAQAYLHAHLLRNLWSSQQGLGAQGTPGMFGQGTVNPWQQQTGVSPFGGMTQRPF